MKDKKRIVLIVLVVAVGLLAILTIRAFSGEDDWLCAGGRWQRHGNPSRQMPMEDCTR
jgi:hypothetical protein